MCRNGAGTACGALMAWPAVASSVGMGTSTLPDRASFGMAVASGWRLSVVRKPSESGCCSHAGMTIACTADKNVSPASGRYSAGRARSCTCFEREGFDMTLRHGVIADGRCKRKRMVKLMTIDKNGQGGAGPEQLRPARMQIETTVL